jgi:hypothetical protein
LIVGWGLDDGDYKKQGFGNASMAITNAEGEREVLRIGTSLNLTTLPELKLKANVVYKVQVTNVNTGTQIARADLLSDMSGLIELSTVAHDIGEFDDVKERDTLSIKVSDLAGAAVTDLAIPLTPHEVHFEGHGFSVDEVQPPHVFSTDGSGKALNSFVVGGAPDPGEVAAPIYVAGKGFPASVSQVDIYLVKDRDSWKGQAIPQPGSSDYILGPVVGSVDRGLLRATALAWTPAGKDIGPYDILVDVDRNGKFDYSFSAKDGADGEQKVGLTIQYGAAWYRAKAVLEGKHLLVNLAFDSAARSGTWANTYTKSSKIYSYVNPPVQSGSRHAFVTKLVIQHQSWQAFWSNPEKYTQTTDGEGVFIADKIVQTTGGTTQNSCTNSPPVQVINPQEIPVDQANPLKFDIVFDYNGDGYYTPGTDLLDVVGHQTTGALVTAKDLEALTEDQIFGFQVTQ